MAKIINNKWYTDEEYDREYHEVVLWGGYLTFLNVLKVEGEEDTYFLNDSIAKFIAGKDIRKRYHLRIQWRYDKKRRYGNLCL